MTTTPLKISVSEKIGSVSALLGMPKEATSLLVLGHGAGAGMTHSFMEQLAENLATQGIASLRYQFPYMERGSKRPDSPKIVYPTILAAINKAQELVPELPLYLGGKSFGGRMSSQLAAMESLEGVKGLVFFGFPLHAIGKSGIKRAEHLKEVLQPMLFLQGTRDKLAEVELIEEVCKGLKTATLQFFEGADHSFKVLKRSGKTQEEVIVAMVERMKKWLG
ncbi:MAG: alpha/beta fold hydrolase [Chitinophagales bacterium]